MEVLQHLIWKKQKYLDLVTIGKYKKVIKNIGYAFKINAKSLSVERVTKYVDEAVKLAQELKNSKYLSDDEKDRIEILLQDRELYYKVCRFRRSIRSY